ncbi:hypothetical protein V6Z12_A09G254900 [Gossypium hirsutum]
MVKHVGLWSALTAFQLSGKFEIRKLLKPRKLGDVTPDTYRLKLAAQSSHF